MHPILRRDVKQLTVHAEEIQKCLEILVHNQTARAWESQHMDLIQLIEQVKRLELDLSTILSGCAFLGRQYWKGHNLRLIECLHQSCDIMNSLYQDLNKIRTAITERRIIPSDLRQLIIDWGRFKESIDQIQTCMEYPLRRRKNPPWPRRTPLWTEGYGDKASRILHESSSPGS